VLAQGERNETDCFLIAVSDLMFLAVCGVAQARPIAPLPPGVASNAANTTPVYYHHWHHRYWHHGGYDPWDYYRVDRPGRGTDVEGTR